MRRSSSAVVLFTLTPEAEGARKPLGLGGSRRSARLFSTLIEHVDSVCAGLSGADLLVASDSPLDLSSAAEWFPQRGGDFGESLRLAVEDAFALGYRSVVVIGNDAPELSRDYLQQALDELASGSRKAVVGPATDGGYNLLGLTAPCSSVFTEMPWGSSEVSGLTVERLGEEGFAVAHLRTMDDIDTVHALVRFLSQWRAGLASLVSRIRRLTEPVRWTLDVTIRHREHPTLAGSHRLRAPPALSRTTL